MIEFILNNEHVVTELPSGSILLNFIRKEKQLTGTKIGCREGDCGACTVLIGSIDQQGKLIYKSVNSCLTPIASAHQRHVVTIEGLNLKDKLTPIQEIFKKNNATQCGFCTPGFIISITGSAFNSDTSISSVMDSIGGNICRCTGYSSIQKSSSEIAQLLVNSGNNGSISKLTSAGILPEYFLNIQNRLLAIPNISSNSNNKYIVGGGTDLYVSQSAEFESKAIDLIESKCGNGITLNNGVCIIEAGASATDIMENNDLISLFTELKSYFKLISSKQIRNTGTLGGNLVNASPIADLAIFFLALNSKISISNNDNLRSIFLKDFFKGYKLIDLNEGEIIQSMAFNIPEENEYFNFEKVSKRTHLDIASVNSAIKISIRNNHISEIHISAGGVAPIPLYLKNTSSFLKGKELTSQNIRKGHCVLKEEISPISDVRGSDVYKKLLLKQLYFAHFIKLFPEKISIADIK